MNEPVVPQRFHVESPGRVNLLGEHLDYNEGVVLPVAIDRVVRLAALPLQKPLVQLQSIDLKQSVVFDLKDTARKVDIFGQDLPPWALYPAGVAHTLQQHGLEVCGVQAVYTSDLPMGAGLSSSAAVEVAFAVLWQALGGWSVDRMTLAEYCRQAESEFVGVNCGLMDQFCCMHGVEDHALYFDTRSLAWQALPLPPETSLVIADSHLPRTLAGSAYNERHAACEQAVALLKPLLPGMRALRDVSLTDLERCAAALPDAVFHYARHVVTECDRMKKTLPILQEGDAPAFGRLMLEGHASLRDDYRVSLPELDALVEIASGLPGCYGARLTGAGFGGCTINLVKSDEAPLFAETLGKAYHARTGRTAQVMLTRASRGAWGQWF